MKVSSVKGVGGTLTHLLDLEREERWMALRDLASEISLLTGDALSKGYALLSRAYVQSATCRDDWRQAKRYAELCRTTCIPGTPRYLWSILQLGIVSVDTGASRQAGIFARSFLRLVKKQPDAAVYRPWAYMTIGRALYSEGEYDKAAFYLRYASVSLTGNEKKRCLALLAWALGQSGRTDEAWALLPDNCDLSQRGRVMLLARCGHYAQAVREGKVAIEGTSQGIDYIDVAETCLIMAGLARRNNDGKSSAELTHRALCFAARQVFEAQAWMTLILLGRGGECFNDTLGTTGSANPHDSCCYTSGIA